MHLVCFSHLRWDFVYQRPQHLLSRCAPFYQVVYIQEFELAPLSDGYTVDKTHDEILLVTPFLNQDNTYDLEGRKRRVIDDLFRDEDIADYICWYYTPLSLLFSDHLSPAVTVYDCMDELSAFRFADPRLAEAEELLLHRADVVFTGGYSLYHVKKHLHDNIHAFPSSIDRRHFESARLKREEPADQEGIPHSRLGFFGVIDERFDIGLIEQAATLQPSWHFIIIGPVVKIDPATLPRCRNIHYLGSKSYRDLPAYLGGWDVAMIPFLLNESTRFISPTKTPEYLAAGKPVVSTPIADVMDPYAALQLVQIVGDAPELVQRVMQVLGADAAERRRWLSAVDAHLAGLSWDDTWEKMHDLVIQQLIQKKSLTTKTKEIYV